MDTAQQLVRIVIADDHPIFREGLRRLLDAEPGFTVVGQAGDGDEAVRSVRELHPDVLLLDLAMPRGGGLETLRHLSEQGVEVRTILLTAEIDRGELVRALQLGARGVVLKESATQLLFKCVRAVINDEYWVGHERVADVLQALREPKHRDKNLAPMKQLTRRELQIVAAIVEGASNRDIAQQLGLSKQTVKNHLSSVFDKVGVSSRLELALFAMRHRLLEPHARQQRDRDAG